MTGWAVVRNVYTARGKACIQICFGHGHITGKCEHVLITKWVIDIIVNVINMLRRSKHTTTTTDKQIKIVLTEHASSLVSLSSINYITSTKRTNSAKCLMIASRHCDQPHG